MLTRLLAFLVASLSFTSILFAQDGKLYCFSNDSFIAIDLKSGSKIWDLKNTLSDNGAAYDQLTNSLFIVKKNNSTNNSIDYSLMSVSASSGEQKWSIQLDKDCLIDKKYIPLIYEDKVFILTSKSLSAYNTTKGTKIWSIFNTSWDSLPIGDVIIGNGILYSTKKCLSSIDPKNGNILWQNCGALYNAPLALKPSFISTLNQILFWNGDPSFGSNELIRMDVIDKERRSLPYELNAKYSDLNDAILAQSKDQLIIRYKDQLICINLRSDSITWKYVLKNDLININQDYNYLITQISANNFQLIDIPTGSIKETINIDLQNSIFARNSLYGFTSNQNSALIAYDFGKKSIRWQYPVAAILSTPLVVFADNKAYYPPTSGMYEENTTDPAMPQSNTLLVSSESRQIAQTSTVDNLSISSSGSWSASAETNYRDWLHISPATGTSTTSGVVSYTVDANTSSEGRSGTILFYTPNGITRIFSLTQAGRPTDVLTTTGPDAYTLAYAADVRSFSLTANNSWTISSNASWLTVAPTSGSATTGLPISFSVTAYAVSVPRSATLTIRSGSLTKTIPIVQEGLYFQGVSPSSLTAPAVGGTGAFTFAAVRAWRITPTQNWITVSPASGPAASNVPVSYTILPNLSQQARTTVLRLAETNGSLLPVEIAVRQASILPSFALSSTTAAVGTSAQTSTFSVTSNVDWTAATDANWLTLSSTSAVAGGNPVSYSVTANTLPGSRTAIITLTGRWTDVDASVKQVTTTHTVTQAALILGTEPIALAGLTVSVYPNPTTDRLTARLVADAPQTLRISLYNIAGRVYETRRTDVRAGEQTISFDVRVLEAGAYLLIVENQAGQLISRKVVKE